MITAVSETTDNAIGEETAVEIARDVSGTVNYMHEADSVVAVDSDTVLMNKVFDSYNLVDYITTTFRNNTTINYCYLVKYSDGGMRLHMDFTWTGEATFTDSETFQILSSTTLYNSTPAALMHFNPFAYPVYNSIDNLCRLYINSQGLYIKFYQAVPYANHNNMNCYAFMVDIPDTSTLGSNMPEPTKTILDSGTTGYDLEYDFTYPALMSLIGHIYTTGDDIREYFNVIVRGQTYNPNLLDITFRWRTGTFDSTNPAVSYTMIPSMYIQTLGLSYVFGRASIISSYCGTSETETLGDCSAGMLTYDSQYGLRFTPYEDRTAGDFLYGHFRIYIPDSSSWDILWNDSLVNFYPDEEMLRLYRYPLTQSVMSKRPLNGFKLYYHASPNIYIEQKADGVLCHLNIYEELLDEELPIYSQALLSEDEDDRRFRPDLFGYLGTASCYISYDIIPMPNNIAEYILLRAEPSEARTDVWNFRLVSNPNSHEGICQDIFIPTAVIAPILGSGEWVSYITDQFYNPFVE